MTTDTAWFHCFAGIAGDMALGSLLDAGADLAEVESLLRRLPLPGWDLTTERVERGGLSCTRAIVTVEDDGTTRPHKVVADAVREAHLPQRVEERALRVFARLAEVEGSIHGVLPEEVHFHEVGGHDAIIDVVGVAAALEVLGVAHVHASAVTTGSGTVKGRHGVLPNPSPAVLRLLAGAPVHGHDTSVELTTPTGAALLASLAESFGPMPAMEISAVGFGAGTAVFHELPNCTEVVLGRSTGAGNERSSQPLVILEANLDDVTGEHLADAIAALLDGGALDAWISPILMKKGRPAHTLHALCDPAHLTALRAAFLKETGSLGVRAIEVERWAEPRSVETVEVDGHQIRIKIGPDRAKAEHDDTVRVARLTGRSVRAVAALAEERWRASGGASNPVTHDERDGDEGR